MSQCRRNGCKSIIDDLDDGPLGVMRIIHKQTGKEVLVGPETDGLYKADIRVTATDDENQHETCETVEESSPKLELRHRRLGHLRPTTMAKSAKIVRGLKIPKPKTTQPLFCEPCVLEKSTRKPRESDSKVPTKAPLERVYSDLFGPTRYPSIGDSTTFLDDYSGFSMARFLRRKGDIIMALKEMMGDMESLLKGKIEKVTVLNRKSINTLRTDGGGEYLSTPLKKWLKERGTHHEVTTAHSPKSNGAAERLNRTLMDMAQTMMLTLDPDIRNCMWVEAVNTANYRRNRVYNNSCKKDMTTFESIHGNPPNLSHLRVFGCAAYVHNTKPRRKNKFGDRSRKGIFIGYDKGKAYRIYLSDVKKIVITKDADFEESSSAQHPCPRDENIIKFNGFDVTDLYATTAEPITHPLDNHNDPPHSPQQSNDQNQATPHHTPAS